MPKPESQLLAYETAPRALVLGADGVHQLDMAEPSPVMLAAQRYWRAFKRGVKGVALAAGLAAYPALMLSAHQVDDSTVALDSALPWAAPEAGVAVTLIAREVKGPGLASDRAEWRPQARLTALPAWQAGLSEALADHAALSARLAGADGRPDPDLAIASRLLRVNDDLAMAPRLAAAAEALARYDGRVDHNLARQASGAEALAEELRLFARWADSSTLLLDARTETPSAWPAAPGDIAAFYTAKARAHAAHELLAASAMSERRLMADPGVRAEVRKVQEIWRRAATQDALFVFNSGPDNLFLANHLTGMAYLLDEAAAASRNLAEELEEARSSIYLADLRPAVADRLP